MFNFGHLAFSLITGNLPRFSSFQEENHPAAPSHASATISNGLRKLFPCTYTIGVQCLYTRPYVPSTFVLSKLVGKSTGKRFLRKKFGFQFKVTLQHGRRGMVTGNMKKLTVPMHGHEKERGRCRCSAWFPLYIRSRTLAPGKATPHLSSLFS